MNIIKKAIIWGDSVAKGVVFDAERGRYTLLHDTGAKKFSEKTGIEVINRAKMGMTVSDGLALIESDLSRGITADAALVEFGGNDSDFDWAAIAAEPDKEHLPKTPIAEYETKMRKIIEELKTRGMNIVLATLPPIMSDRYFEFISRGGLSKENILKWLGDKNHIYRFHEKYSLVISRLAQEYQCKLIDVRSAFLDIWNTGDYICIDGIHPNGAGQELIGKVALQGLA